MREFIINQNDSGQRLDKYLTKAFKKLPPSLLHKYIRTKRIKVNDKKTAADYKLLLGDNIKLYINDEFFENSDEENNSYLKITPKLSIVYEDENILLVNKPKGVIVHSDNNEDYNTLINHIKAYLYNKGEFIPEKENSFTPSLCNRIDRNTQGIVIAAKTAAALRVLNEKIKNREIKKYYLCIVHGFLNKKNGTLKGYIIKDSNNNTVKVFNESKEGAKTIITRYKVLKEKDNLSLVEVELETGRTHQIRAHFASIAHPLLGDGKYGTNKLNEGYNLKSQALCAYKIKFDFVNTENCLKYLNNLEFKIDVPDIFKSF